MVDTASNITVKLTVGVVVVWGLAIYIVAKELKTWKMIPGLMQKVWLQWKESMLAWYYCILNVLICFNI